MLIIIIRKVKGANLSDGMKYDPSHPWKFISYYIKKMFARLKYLNMKK